MANALVVLSSTAEDGKIEVRISVGLMQGNERPHHLPTRESPRTHLYKSYLIKEQRRGEVDRAGLSLGRWGVSLKVRVTPSRVKVGKIVIASEEGIEDTLIKIEVLVIAIKGVLEVALIISCLLAAALAAPPQLKLAPNEPIPILAQSNIVNEDGTFQNSYESADGTRAESSGSLKSLGPQEEGQVIQGSYSFYTPDGQLYELRYIADENGFQPQGNFLPVAPPIPEEILKSLAYNAAHPEEDNLRK
uniref:Larval cuticle protein LCP-17 n=1 Tax=Timema shepardi TaxID=629360 RepID=A0A7R9ASQ8_TIMSH|nr:unnamed protein product [Timema shepardi]